MVVHGRFDCGAGVSVCMVRDILALSSALTVPAATHSAAQCQFVAQAHSVGGVVHVCVCLLSTYAVVCCYTSGIAALPHNYNYSHHYQYLLFEWLAATCILGPVLAKNCTLVFVALAQLVVCLCFMLAL
jgi:hypothetical protein